MLIFKFKDSETLTIQFTDTNGESTNGTMDKEKKELSKEMHSMPSLFATASSETSMKKN